MTSDLPYKWIKDGPFRPFKGKPAPGEFYAFQIGVYPISTNIRDIKILFSDLKNKEGNFSISASSFRCFNTGGINWNGKKFKKVVSVEKGKVQPLWFGVQIPQNIPPGKYKGSITIIPEGLEKRTVEITLNITDKILKDAGDSEPWRHSRLRWLDSKIAFDDGIVPPFTPMEARNNTVSCLGRELTFGKNGLPVSIKSFFAPEVTHLIDKGRQILSSPIKLIVEDSNSNILSWESTGSKIIKKNEGAVEWKSRSSSGPLAMYCNARMEFDGFVQFKVKIKSYRDVKVNDIRLEIPIWKDVAKYMMGLGFKGGYMPAKYEWKWDVKKNQDAIWIGDVNAGLQVSFRGANYSRPLNTNFYQLKPLNLPVSWYNNGKGGCKILEINQNMVLIKTYSGSRTIHTGEELQFNFNLLLTPFKTLDTKNHWKNRYFHSFKSLDEIAKTGANVINVHHATRINPYINYPFLRPEEMKNYIDEAHKKGFKVKIYYTIRELSNHAPEIFALRSLGFEIFPDGPGGGYSWLQEHLGSNYIKGWFVPKLKDAAIINSGMSRWHNYYLEGLNWLTRNVGIDGLYIDDVAFDRTTMKRVRKILDRNRKGALIDLHSANQYNPRDGFASSANLYFEHFPYLNRIWFGEYFDYNSSPDYWLIEISGIPFGVMGEMLQGGGNPWRGIIYGMTSRLPWAGNPTNIWKVWDEFGIKDSKMVGYWSPYCPVKTNHKDILATAYVKNGKTLVSIASWAKEKVNCILKINWNYIRINPEKAVISAPFIKDFQSQAIFKPDDEIPVQSGKGWLLIISER